MGEARMLCKLESRTSTTTASAAKKKLNLKKTMAILARGAVQASGNDERAKTLKVF
jgi:hypothetical protein